MAQAKEKGAQPIIVKRVKKAAAGHHGGAWKVAYADFVTAMMAFFLLLWLLNSVTPEQLEGISNYFAPASVAKTTSGAGGVLGGQTIAEEGAEQTVRAKPTVSLALPPPRTGTGGDAVAGRETSTEVKDPQELTEKEMEELVRKREEQQFQEAEKTLAEAIKQVATDQKQLADSLMIDSTPEGLRIQIVDQEGLAMFPRGSADMYEHTKRMLTLVGKVIEKMPQEIAITGHTDAVKFAGGERGYSNWELSVDRANASRRVLTEQGIPEKRLARVVGMAANDPIVAEDPNHPRNRRISIVLLRGTGEQPPAVPLERKEGEKKAEGPAKPAPVPAIAPPPSGIKNGTRK
jgi:chemotaxis protein MotB